MHCMNSFYILNSDNFFLKEEEIIKNISIFQDFNYQE